MGCGASTEAAAVNSGSPATANHRTGTSAARNPYEAPPPSKKQDNPQELAKSSGIDRNLEHAKQQEELKVKLLLLGAGESGKSTVFKQMRILHGNERSEDDQRMYGVIVRSNIITAMRKLCAHLRGLGLEEQLAQEGPPENNANDESSSGMTPKEAFDLLIAHLVDNTANPNDLPKPDMSNDWVGENARAGLNANNDMRMFLALWKPIKTLWEVRGINSVRVLVVHRALLLFTHTLISLFHLPPSLAVQDHERSMVQTSGCQCH